MRAVTIAVVATLAVAGCASKSPTSSRAAGPGPTTGAPTPTPGRTTQFVLPTPAPPPINPCKLSAAEISAVVGFTVAKGTSQSRDQCDYPSVPEGGSVWFRVSAQSANNIPRAKADETFSLGGKYITITDESGFPHEALTAVKNPGDKSPGVIADAVVYLGPGELVLRIYYPQGGRPPGRANALTLAHKMLA